jgi:hypothetical protein
MGNSGAVDLALSNPTQTPAKGLRGGAKILGIPQCNARDIFEIEVAPF